MLVSSSLFALCAFFALSSFSSFFVLSSLSRVPFGCSWLSFGCFWVPFVCSWAPFGCLLGSLGLSWGALGRSWGALGRSWGALEASWDALGTLLGRSWGAPGDPRSVLGDLGSILDPPRVDLGPSGHRFLGLRKLLREALGGRFCKRLATDLRAIRERFASSTNFRADERQASTTS